MNLRDSIGVALISGFLIALGVLFFKAIPEANSDLIVYMLGQLSGFAGGIVAYHYTLSKQSEEATANTGKAFEAFTAAVSATPPDDAPARAAQETADAAQAKADSIEGSVS